jgi:hypothetical protein
MNYRIRLHNLHLKSGLSISDVRKRTGVALNTIKKYVLPAEVVQDELPVAVIRLIQFYGADWRDPTLIEIVENDESPNKKPTA